MQRDVFFLRDIVESIDAMELFWVGLNEDVFVGTDVVRCAVMYKLIIIGEAVRQLSPELQEANPHVPWAQVVAFRNRATHAYMSTDWSMVYEIASVQALELRGQVQAIIDQLESASRPAQEGDS